MAESVSERVAKLRKAGVGSAEVARRCGIERREVNRIMRQRAKEVKP